MKTLFTAAFGAAAIAIVSASAPVAAQAPTSCETTAKGTIDWIVSQNLRVRRQLEDTIRLGATPYDALLRTERNNPIGLAAFRECSDWTRGYLNTLNLGAPRTRG